MYALTVWQPWAWAISQGLKLIENRDWLPNWRLLKPGDDLAITSAVKEPSSADMKAMRAAVRAMGAELPPNFETSIAPPFGRGRVVAVVRYVGVAHSMDALPESQRPWWRGKYAWQFEHVRQLDIGSAPRVIGQQSLWPLQGVEDLVLRQLAKHNEGQLWRKTA